MDSILFALWFFLPAGIANAAPILGAKAPLLAKLDAPMDMGKSYKGKRLLGQHKTWRGLAIGILAAVATVYAQQVIFQHYNLPFIPEKTSEYMYLSPVILGLLFGLGALLGDAAESLLKRRRKIAPGAAWFPFDQIDYVIGGCLLAAVVVRLDVGQYVLVLISWFLMHIMFSYLGYLLKLKSSPI